MGWMANRNMPDDVSSEYIERVRNNSKYDD